MKLIRPLLLALGLIALRAAAQPCLVSYTFTASPPPSNGTYACGQTVTFCFTVTNWNSTNANWFHGIVASFGPGWDMSTLTPGAPPASCSGSGYWAWYNSVQGTAATNIGPQGPGFFYNYNTPADGNPGNNFGDFCTGAVNWQFCWTISVLSGAACINGLGLSVSVNTFGDSETGGWGSSGCTQDAIVPSAPAVIQGCTANAGTNGSLSLCSTAGAQSLFAALGGTPQAGGTWTGPGGASTGTFTPGIDAPGPYTYTVASVGLPCTASATVNVAVQPQPSAGTNGALTLCASDAPAALFAQLGGAPTAGGTWTGPGGPSSGTFNPAIDASGTFTYTVNGAAPCVAAAATVQVTVNPSPNAGTSGSVTVCSNGAAAQLFNSLGGSPSPGGSWTGPNGAAFGGLYLPGINTPGSYIYTVTGTAPCPNSSATVTVTENALPNAGSSAAIALCNAGASVNLTNQLGGTPAPNGTWTAPGGGTVPATLNPATAASGVYIYTVPGAAPCPDANAQLTITIASQPNAGTNGSLNLCQGAAPVGLGAALGGNPTAGGTWTNPAGQAVSATFTPGTSAPGIYTYTVNAVAPCQTAVATVNVSVNPQPNAGTNAATTVCSSGSAVALFPLLGASAQAGGTWSGPGGGASSGTFTPGSSTDGAYTYTITGIAPCTNASATVTVTTVSAPNAGTGGSLNLCTSGAATALLPALGGAPQAGGTWTGPNGAAMNGILNPSTAASGTYTYTVAGSAPCPSASASVTVSIATAPNAGNNGTANLCSSQSTAYALISGLNGNPSAGGSWTGPNAAPHGPDFLVGNDAPGTYTYTVSGAAPCPSASSTLQVNVTQAANAGIGGQVSLCVNGAPVSPSSWLAGNPDAGGTWSGPGGSINGTVDPANAVSGTYTYALPANGPCPAAAAAVQLVIDPLPNAGNDAALVMCVNGPAMNLFNALGNQAQSGGSWQGPSGPASAQFNPGTSTQGIYTYTVIGSGACTGTSDQATISISVNALPIPVFEAIPAAGCVPLQVQFINSNAASTQSAQWQFGDGEAVSAAAGTWHTYQTDGRFDVSLTVTDANGCTSTLTVNHAVHASAGPAPDFNALPRRVPITGPVTNVTHEPAAGATYTWRVDGEPVDTSGSFQWTFPQEVGIHTICLTATDALGCSNEACIAISVEDELTIYVPNAFTPNNDGKNEVFKPSIIGVERDWYEFIVFDRWGRQVFRTTNPDEGWNGGFNNGGEVLPDGVYLWGLRAKDQWTPAKRDILGSVTLLK